MITQEEFLLQQGTQIILAISRAGYLTRRMTRGDLISWEITRPDSNWWVMLTFIPRPVEQWQILPPSHYDDRQRELYRIIEETIRKADANANGGRR